MLLGELLELQQCGCPRQCVFGRARVGVGIILVAIPRDAAGGGDELAVDAHLVVLPCEGLVQFGEIRVGLRRIDDAAVVIDLTIVWQ